MIPFFGNSDYSTPNVSPASSPIVPQDSEVPSLLDSNDESRSTSSSVSTMKNNNISNNSFNINNSFNNDNNNNSYSNGSTFIYNTRGSDGYRYRRMRTHRVHYKDLKKRSGNNNDDINNNNINNNNNSNSNSNSNSSDDDNDINNNNTTYNNINYNQQDISDNSINNNINNSQNNFNNIDNRTQNNINNINNSNNNLDININKSNNSNSNNSNSGLNSNNCNGLSDNNSSNNKSSNNNNILKPIQTQNGLANPIGSLYFNNHDYHFVMPKDVFSNIFSPLNTPTKKDNTSNNSSNTNNQSNNNLESLFSTPLKNNNLLHSFFNQTPSNHQNNEFNNNNNSVNSNNHGSTTATTPSKRSGETLAFSSNKKKKINHFGTFTIVNSGSCIPEVYKIQKKIVSIGSKRINEIFIPDLDKKTLAFVKVESRKVYISPYESTIVKVNGKEIQGETELSNSDIVNIKITTMVFRDNSFDDNIGNNSANNGNNSSVSDDDDNNDEAYISKRVRTPVKSPVNETSIKSPIKEIPTNSKQRKEPKPKSKSKKKVSNKSKDKEQNQEQEVEQEAEDSQANEVNISKTRTTVADQDKQITHPNFFRKTFSISPYFKSQDKEKIQKFIKDNHGYIESNLSNYTNYLVVSDDFFFPTSKLSYKSATKVIRERSLYNGGLEVEKFTKKILGKKVFSIYPSKESEQNIKDQIENNHYIKKTLGIVHINADEFRDNVFEELSHHSNFPPVEYGSISLRSKVHYVICLVQPPPGLFNPKNYGTLVTLEWFFDCLKSNSFIDPCVNENLYTYPH